jgi:hypothetical protein
MAGVLRSPLEVFRGTRFRQGIGSNPPLPVRTKPFRLRAPTPPLAFCRSTPPLDIHKVQNWATLALFRRLKFLLEIRSRVWDQVPLALFPQRKFLLEMRKEV